MELTNTQMERIMRSAMFKFFREPLFTRIIEEELLKQTGRCSSQMIIDVDRFIKEKVGYGD